MPDSPADNLQPLRKAIDGLLYPSESDDPFELFTWQGTTGDAAVAIRANAKTNEPLQEVQFDKFFDDLKTSSGAAQFAKLRDALNAALQSPKVFRAGEVEVAIFIIGRTASGDWVGVRTTSIET